MLRTKIGVDWDEVMLKRHQEHRKLLDEAVGSQQSLSLRSHIWQQVEHSWPSCLARIFPQNFDWILDFEVQS